MGVGFFSANTTIKIAEVVNESGSVASGNNEIAYTVPAGKTGVFWGGADNSGYFTVDGSKVGTVGPNGTGIFLASDGAVIRFYATAGTPGYDLHGFVLENSPA